jgi:hypothetical protein
MELADVLWNQQTRITQLNGWSFCHDKPNADLTTYSPLQEGAKKYPLDDVGGLMVARVIRVWPQSCIFA